MPANSRHCENKSNDRLALSMLWAKCLAGEEWDGSLLGSTCCLNGKHTDKV